jgi:hypothetical protein
MEGAVVCNGTRVTPTSPPLIYCFVPPVMGF